MVIYGFDHSKILLSSIPFPATFLNFTNFCKVGFENLLVFSGILLLCFHSCKLFA